MIVYLVLCNCAALFNVFDILYDSSKVNIGFRDFIK
jgi:hypothetical protein